MKFLLVTELFPKFPGGAEYHGFRMLKELQRRGHDVSVFCSYIKDLITSEEAGFPIHSCRVNDLDKDFDKAIEVLGKPDVILASSYWARMFFEQMKRLNVPMCDIVHNPVVREDFDYYLFNSNNTKIEALKLDKKELKIYSKKSFVIYPLCNHLPIARMNNFEYDVGMIKLTNDKGQKIFWELAKKFPDKKFLAVRGAWDKLDVLETLPNVTMIPYTTDIVNDFFKKIRVHLHPSYAETFGMAALESLYLGVPLLFRNIDGLYESVGEGGVSCRDNDFEQNLRNLFNVQEYNNIKVKGFKHAAEIYDKTMEQYDDWLGDLNGSK
jgi:glycosyltransferase involved in cell wall biosynthesis